MELSFHPHSYFVVSIIPTVPKKVKPVVNEFKSHNLHILFNISYHSSIRFYTKLFPKWLFKSRRRKINSAILLIIFPISTVFLAEGPRQLKILGVVKLSVYILIILYRKPELYRLIQGYVFNYLPSPRFFISRETFILLENCHYFKEFSLKMMCD